MDDEDVIVLMKDADSLRQILGRRWGSFGRMVMRSPAASG
jgi:hypothetical protein